MAIGDLHYKKDNAPDTLKLTERILEVISSEAPHMVIYLGDSLDRFEDIKMDPQRRVIELFRQTRRLLVRLHSQTNPLMIVLIGNHDRPSPQGYRDCDHPFTALEEWSNTLVVSRPVRFQYQGVSMICAPYIPPGGFVEKLRHADFVQEWLEPEHVNYRLVENGTVTPCQKEWDSVSIIFGHQELSGVDFNGRMSKAEPWPDHAPLLVNGHIHAHSLIKDNFLCLGAPIQHEYEDNPQRYFGIFEVDETNLGLTHRFVPVGVTNKTRINLHVDELDDFKCPKGQLKIVITGPKGTEATYRNDPRVRKWRKKGVVVKFAEIKTEPVKVQLHNEQSKILPYLTRLKEAVRNDPKQLKLYRELFE